MFIGHYAPAFAGKTIAQSVPLWVLFVAVQLVDIGWGVFVSMGIEHVRIVEGFTATNDLDLYDMPWTHSLAMVLVWSAAAGLIWSMLARRQKVLGGLVVGGAVLSHWLVDLIVHVPDLALYPGSDVMLGFGLWNNFPAAMAVEFGLLFGAMLLYARYSVARGLIGRLWPFIAAFLMSGLMYLSLAAPAPEDTTLIGPMAVALYAALCAIAAGFDLTRTAK